MVIRCFGRNLNLLPQQYRRPACAGYLYAFMQHGAPIVLFTWMGKRRKDVDDNYMIWNIKNLRNAAYLEWWNHQVWFWLDVSHAGKSAEKKSLCESGVDGIMILTCVLYIEEAKSVFVPKEIPTIRLTRVKGYILILHKIRNFVGR